MILDDSAYMPRFESANTSTDLLEDSEAEDSGDNAATTGSSNKRKANSKADNAEDEEIGDKRKKSRGKGKRKIAIGEYSPDIHVYMLRSCMYLGLLSTQTI